MFIMNPIFPRYHGIPKPHTAGTDEAETLQTDVMRFMAILGICLMIIFALVKTLPMAPATTQPPVPPTKALEMEVQNHLNKTKVLRIERSVLLEDIKKRKKEVATTKTKQLNNKKISTTTTVEKTTQKGFILKFSSDNALTHLIKKSDIRFFAVSNKTAWQLLPTGNRITFQSSPLPLSFYEMASDTVPVSYIDAFHNTVSVFDGNIIWGVTLPKMIQMQINNQMTGKTGGTLVINENGRVMYFKTNDEFQMR